MKYEDAKRQVNALRAYLKEKEIILTLGHCYECLARIYGYQNWDTFCAILKKNEGLSKC